MIRVRPKVQAPVLIYNDCCPFCSDVAHWLQREWDNRIVLVPNSEEWAIMLHPDLNEDTIKQNVHLITVDSITSTRHLYSAGEAVANVLSMHKYLGWIKAMYRIWPLGSLMEFSYYILKKTKKYYG